MKHISLTIGIPAYNEEANIGHLLVDITKQKKEGYVLTEIIICSDASTDKTDSIARSFSGLPISVLIHQKRTGKAGVLNSIFKKTTADALIILDADIHISDPLFLAKLVSPIAKGTADLSAAKLSELSPKTFFESLLAASMPWKRELFHAVRNGNNVYTCYGRGRAFSRRLYRTIRFKESTNEDAYSYLYCTYHRFGYVYVPGAVLWYRLPQTLKDHELQSFRFFQSRSLCIHEFGEKFVTQAYWLPTSVLIKTLARSIVKHPLLIVYFFVTTYLGIRSRITKRVRSTWAISKSTKIIKDSTPL